MSSHTIEDLTSCILDYQANVVRATYRRKITMVEPDVVSDHAEILARIWADSKVVKQKAGMGFVNGDKLDSIRRTSHRNSMKSEFLGYNVWYATPFPSFSILLTLRT